MRRFTAALVLLTWLGAPTTSHAALLWFGGLQTIAIPCTCSPFTQVYFAPMYPSPPFPLAGSLDYGLSTITHPHFLVGVPSKWGLGQYIPGVVSCWDIAVPTCLPRPSWGLMFRIGTSG
jgi:hypothetical protein